MIVDCQKVMRFGRYAREKRFSFNSLRLDSCPGKLRYPLAGRKLHERKEMVMALEEPIIRLRNVGKEFKTTNGPVVALDDINLGDLRNHRFIRCGKEYIGKVYQHAGNPYLRTGDL